MSKILITGASGFIGYNLAKWLVKQGHDVHCLVRPTSNLERLIPLGVHFRYGDMNDLESLESVVNGPDVIYHLAGRVRAPSSEAFLETNTRGTSHLIQVAKRQKNPPVFIYVSSLAAMGPSHKGISKKELDIPTPVSGYGKSKLACERELCQVAAEMPCTIIRPGIVFGPADSMNLELFKTVHKLNLIPVPGWRDKVHAWIHVEDLISVLTLAAESGERLLSDSLTAGSAAVGRGIYFGMAENIKLSQIGQLIAQSFGRSGARVFQCPPLMILAVSTFYEILKRTTGRDQPFDWDKAFEAKFHWTCCGEKSRQKLNFRLKYSLQERFFQTTQWYFEQGWLSGKFSLPQDSPTT